MLSLSVGVFFDPEAVQWQLWNYLPSQGKLISERSKIYEFRKTLTDNSNDWENDKNYCPTIFCCRRHFFMCLSSQNSSEMNNKNLISLCLFGRMSNWSPITQNSRWYISALLVTILSPRGNLLWKCHHKYQKEMPIPNKRVNV